MKVKYLLYMLTGLLFVSCGDDNEDDPNGGQKGTENAANEWIESIMRDHYYWYDEIPAAGKLNYSLTAADFFESLLSDKDGKDGMHFSYIENTAAATKVISNTDNSYGFDFEVYHFNTGISGTYVVRVTYVVSGSPASDANLERGDWITAMNGEYITANNYRNLFNGGALSLTIGQYNTDSNAIADIKKLEMSASRAIEDDPVYYHSVIETNRGNVGYLVYNGFVDGRTGSDQAYNDELRSLSQEFKSMDVADFILDLRYNGGGSLSAAILLSAILAPESALDQTFGSLRYNDKQSPREVTFKLGKTTYLRNGANLNLKRLYVLTTNGTASASELLIHCLSPFMEVITIGETTVGKNVGSVEYSSDEHHLLMHPIVCQVYDKNGNSDYSNGIEPDYAYDAGSIHTYYPFGDERDIYLTKALSLIEGVDSRSHMQQGTPLMKLVYSSLSRKATPGVLIK